MHRREGPRSNRLFARFAQTVASFTSATMQDGPDGIHVCNLGLQTGVASPHFGLALVYSRRGAADR